MAKGGVKLILSSHLYSWRMSINSETILYPSHIHGPNSSYLHSEVNASYFQYMRENREKTPSTSGVTHGRVGRPAGIIILII